MLHEPVQSTAHPAGVAVPETSSFSLPTPRKRLDSVDLLRGLVMVVMALDHVRDFFTSSHFDPTDLTQTTIPLFFTRWITHFCAPVFVFLAGTGAFLSRTRGKSARDLSQFLLTRGLWLIVLEFTVVRFAWTFNVDYSFVFGQVIWAIGISMVVLAGLVRLPVKAVAAFGIAMIALHNLLDPLPSSAFGSFDWLWNILHTGAVIQASPQFTFLPFYPLVPWIGVMAAGYAFGSLLRREQPDRKRVLLRLGLSLTAAFIVIRAINLYGDPVPWSGQETAALTVLSFLNCLKYPPSLLYLLMTLGPAITLLAVLEHRSTGLLSRITVFGRVPMFYYILHIALVHGIAVALALARGEDTGWLFASLPFGYTPDYGYGLVTVYCIWIGVVVALYPLCAWFAGVKRRRKDWWLSYL